MAIKLRAKHKLNPNNVLVIADTHLPFEKPGYLEFCLATQKKYNCGTVIHIGDEIDNCAINQYLKDPDGMSNSDEADLAQLKMYEIGRAHV